jgi:hypothetical protein
MNAPRLVNLLLEAFNPYDIDDPLEKPTPEELAAGEKTNIEKQSKRLLNLVADREQLNLAARAYFDLQNRKTDPEGNFDSGGRWYPSDAEKQACCASIRSPSRNFPYSYLLHCRSVQHVAQKHGVDSVKLRRFIRTGSVDN